LEHIIVEHKLDKQTLDALNKYFNLETTMIFDIETTGLSPKSSNVILIGFIVFEDDTAFIHQLFAEHTDEEVEILKNFVVYCRKVDTLINFNGSSFDIPYLNKRFCDYGNSYQIHPKLSFDLDRICRSSRLDVINYKLKTLEIYLGIPREDMISGRESISLYFDYMRNHNEESREIVLKHNYEDILHLIPFIKILDHIEMNLIERHFSKSLVIDNYTFILDTIKVSHDFVSINMSISNTSLYTGKVITYYDPYVCILNEGTIHIKLPIFDIKTPDDSIYTFVDAENVGWIHDFNQISLEEKKKYIISENQLFNYFNVLNIIKYVVKEIASPQ